MSDFDAQILESQKQVAEAQQRISELTSRIEQEAACRPPSIAAGSDRRDNRDRDGVLRTPGEEPGEATTPRPRRHAQRG